MLVVAGVSIAAAVARRAELVPGGTMVARPGVPAVVLSRFLLLYGFVAVDAFVPFAVTDVRGRSVLAGSIAVTAGTLTWTAGTWSAERLGKRHPGPTVVRWGFVILASGVIDPTCLPGGIVAVGGRFRRYRRGGVRLRHGVRVPVRPGLVGRIRGWRGSGVIGAVVGRHLGVRRRSGGHRRTGGRRRERHLDSGGCAARSVGLSPPGWPWRAPQLRAESRPATPPHRS